MKFVRIFLDTQWCVNRVAVFMKFVRIFALCQDFPRHPVVCESGCSLLKLVRIFALCQDFPRHPVVCTLGCRSLSGFLPSVRIFLDTQWCVNRVAVFMKLVRIFALCQGFPRHPVVCALGCSLYEVCQDFCPLSGFS